MYLSHYNLKEKPFQISTDPKFIWFGEKHREALAVLEYGVIDNKGFLLITGDVGTGKTTLINALLKRLGNDVVVANITNPILEELDFFNIVADEFNINKHFSNKADFLIHFSRFLNDCYTKKKKVILVIDEAHKLDQDLLEQIRLFSNIERQNTKLINIFFVGQNEFIDIISDNQNRALRQRISINYHLGPLRESEVREYILQRLNVAGLKENIFNDNSISEINSFSKGYPRLINIICDHALLTGYVKGVKTIDEEIIRECANGLFLTRENDDDSKNDLKITQEAIPETEKEPTITPSEYTNRYNLPEEKIDYLLDNPQTIERKTHEFVEEPSLKLSSKNFRYLAVAAILVIALGFLYYPGNLSGHIGNIKNYFKPAPNVQEKIASANIPKNTTSKQNINSAIQGSNKHDDTQFQSTELAAERYHPPTVEKKNVTVRQEIYRTQKLPPAEDVNQEKSPDKPDNIFKSQEVPKHKFITSQKYTINYSNNSYDFSDKNVQTLKRIAKLLVQHPKADIIVKGHTDSHGNNEYNKKLSKLRAHSVKSYFVNQGINFSRIKAFGMGKKNPIESNNTLEGRRRNRRVEIELIIHKT
ncbi:MAG: OmpA family protein [Desulfobacteraceae bacterium]|nr:OmpA family protein [Desulfobacteraceae bacterium]MDH3572612.1 OmpA family protein [Desulfobacteraceae bacterium]MDH3721292.1 OmpA family protein [Desulfobacteraceae bacterium]MDH3835235.1 OmpA family protein [Desulfobacteraceae bacterium]